MPTLADRPSHTVISLDELERVPLEAGIWRHDPRTREWAVEDRELDSIRDDPGYPG